MHQSIFHDFFWWYSFRTHLENHIPALKLNVQTDSRDARSLKILSSGLLRGTQSLPWSSGALRWDISTRQTQAGHCCVRDRGDKRGKPHSKHAFHNASSGSSVFWRTKRTLPRVHTHTHERAGQATKRPPPKKNMFTACSKRVQRLGCRELSSSSKFIYLCGATLQVTSEPPTQHTLWYCTLCKLDQNCAQLISQQLLV